MVRQRGSGTLGACDQEAQKRAGWLGECVGMGQACHHLSWPSAVLQSVLCGADALVPVRTGAAGSASLTLLGNGSLLYQVQGQGLQGLGRAVGQGPFAAFPVPPPLPWPPGPSGGDGQ